MATHTTIESLADAVRERDELAAGFARDPVAGGQKLVEALAARYAITIEWRPPSHMPADSLAYAISKRRLVVVPPFTKRNAPETLATCLHEIAHVLEPECTWKPPHLRPWKECCLQCEVGASRRSLDLWGPFTAPMFETLAGSLRAYVRRLEATPEAVAAATALMHADTFRDHRAQWQARHDRLARHAAVVASFRSDDAMLGKLTCSHANCRYPSAALEHDAPVCRLHLGDRQIADLRRRAAALRPRQQEMTHGNTTLDPRPLPRRTDPPIARHHAAVEDRPDAV